MEKLFYNEAETREALGIKDPAVLRRADKFLQPFRTERNVRIYQVSKLEQRYIAYLKSMAK